MNWLGHEGCHFIQTLNEEEKFKPSIGLLGVLNEKFRPQHNETFLSLQYYGNKMNTQRSGWARSESKLMNVKKRQTLKRTIHN